MSNEAYYKYRLKPDSAYQVFKARYGGKITDKLTNIVHENHSDSSFVEKEKMLDQVCRIVVTLQDCVELYYDKKESGTLSGTILDPEFEAAKERILLAGKLLEEGEIDLPELLTADIPLFRTIAHICAKHGVENG